MLSVNRRRQALRFCLYPAVIVVIQIFNEFLFELLYGTEPLQIQQFTFEQPEEVFYHSIIRTVSFSAHALLNTFLLEHSLILPVLVLPALIGVKNKVCSVQAPRLAWWLSACFCLSF